jgi:regulator of sigma E protease
MSWVWAIAGIVTLVILHELGHFVVAKAVGMRVERFSLFFPPKIFGIRRGETEYMIGAIPLGGYVKITGMTPLEAEELEPEVKQRAYYLQAPWKRVAVILAGPGVNLVIAFILFWAILLVGNLDGATALSSLDPSLNAVEVTTAVANVESGEPATGVLRAKDRLVAINGQAIHSATTAERTISAERCAGTPTDGCKAQHPLTLTILRSGKTINLPIYPRYNKQAGRMIVGIEFGSRTRPYGPLAAAGASGGAMWGITRQTVTGFVHAITSSKVRHETSSIIGITQDAQQSVVAGAGFAFAFIGFISLVLAVINLFPFLPLDGGHVLWAVVEKLRKRRVSLNAMWAYSSIGIVLFGFLVANGVSNDLSRLGG